MSEFKNLPSGWKVVRLGEICNVKQGLQIPISERFCENAKNRYFYITNEFLKENSEVKYYIENPPEGTICFCDDILMTRTGNTGRIVTNVSGVFHNNFFKIIYDRQIIKKEYFVFLLTGSKIQNEILKRAGSSTIPDLNHGDFLSIKISIPPLDEQEKIAEILSTWDEAINLTINLIESKKQFKKALMQNLLTAKIRFPHFKDEWRAIKLSEICDISTGTSKSRFIGDGKFYIVDMGSITQDGLLNLTKTTNLNQDFLDFGDLVMPKDDIGGGKIIGKVAVIDKDNAYVLSDHIFRIKTIENSNFLAYLINSDLINKKIRREVSGTAQLGLSKRTIENLKIKLPNLKEQQKIAEVLMACDDEINLLNLKLENLKKQKQGLMQKLLSGKVRTK